MKKLTLLLLITIFTITAEAQTNNGIAKGTIITLADGTEISVEEVKKDDLLLSLKEDGTSIVVSRISEIQKTNTKQLIKVVLANGTEIVVTPNHPMLSNRGWASSDNKATKSLKKYESMKVHPYKVDSFLYTLSPDVKIEVLPIIDIEEMSIDTPIYRLVLDTPASYIANGVFVGQ